MSFMFHPHPYDDPRAVNPVDAPDVRAAMVEGLLPVAKRIAEAVRGGKRRVGIDGYPGAQFRVLIETLAQQLGGCPARFVDSALLLPGEEAFAARIAPYLPEDRDIDPALLYGARYEGGYSGLQDADAVRALRDGLSGQGVTIVYGPGALEGVLREQYDLRIWMDITPKRAALNFKHGLARNLGASRALPYGLMMRRNYYVDFECAVRLRWLLLREDALDWYVAADNPERMRMLPLTALRTLFDALTLRPLRCRPVYLEGVWGGHYIQRLRNLPDSMRNCAWVFDMIPMEVSLAADLGGVVFETPFFTFVQAQGEKLLGADAMARFGGYFPVRFNYDDTFHSSGNMSIQCHPGESWCRQAHNELGRQDESYYVCVAGDGAKTYLGFREEDSREAFLAEAEAAQATRQPFDYARYIHAVPSIPGTQVMIPAGTVHASGHNQVILEIGSLTMGSYTYKLYDYLRTDPQTGLPRPIHLKAGRQALKPGRTRAWVEENLVNHGYPVREGDGWAETVIGEHDLLYFSLRKLSLTREMPDDTRGAFHVLTLVEGEQVRVESMDDPSRAFEMRYLDIVVVPASLGAYRIVNRGVGRVVLHKTQLKDHA